MASKFIIEECVDESVTGQSRCTYQTPSNTPSFNLTCVVSGFKPNISMFWTYESGERLNSTVSQQATLSDDTYERFETITVSSTHQAEQTFKCVATGDSLNGTSTTGIIVLPLQGKSNNSDLAIGLPFGVVAASVILFLLLGIFLGKHHTYNLQEACGLYPCWRLFKTQRPDHADVELMMTRSFPTFSLTENQVQQCKNDLKAYYLNTRRKVTVDPLNYMERVNLDEIYTNLSLTNPSDMHKTPITYEDILTNDGTVNLSKRLLIQGEGGVGKTTLCSKIAWDWCQGRILQDLDMVIVIPLRDVIVDKTIGDIVERYLSDSNESTAAQIDDYISTKLSKVLLVFDGFDEFSEKIGESSSEIIRILGLEQYESCKVIVTSRPWRTDAFRLTKSLAEAYTFISVQGFNKENLGTYINKYFRIRDNDSLAETLLSFIEENDVIRCNMAPFPIFCAMLCLMWKDISEERRQNLQKLQTFSEIFGEMISFLKEHYASNFCENLQKRDVIENIKEATSAIQAISETALVGLLERKLLFPEKHFKKCQDSMEICCKVGVLTIERDIINRKLRRGANIPSFVVSTVSFPHKLFQEYIASLYLGNLFASDRAKFDKVKYKFLLRYEEFRFLLYFASSLEKDLGHEIIDGLIESGDQYFCLDVAFECHTSEAARTVGKQWKEYELIPKMSEHTKSGVVFLVHCSQPESLLINKVNCGRTVSRYLAEDLCSSSAPRKVTMDSSRLHNTFYTIVGTEGWQCQIEDVDLSLQSWNDTSAENLARWVCTMPKISSFSLKCPYVPDYFLSTAVDLASSCQIQNLDLSFHSWKDESQDLLPFEEHLAEWVCTMPNLSSFSLECPYIHGSFLSTAAALPSKCQIDKLKLSQDVLVRGSGNLSSVGGDLSRWLCTMARLSDLTLARFQLTHEFFSTAASCKIKHLKLIISNWETHFQHPFSLGKDLVQWVCTLPSLSSFSVECCYLSDDFLSTAVELAQSCQIQELAVEFFMGWISEPAAAAKLAEFLCRMPNLTRADLKCHNLPETFFMTVASQAKRCKLDCITVDGKPVQKLIDQWKSMRLDAGEQ
ncbi:uncharacterized protein [Diadema antillarum]